MQVAARVAGVLRPKHCSLHCGRPWVSAAGRRSAEMAYGWVSVTVVCTLTARQARTVGRATGSFRCVQRRCTVTCVCVDVGRSRCHRDTDKPCTPLPALAAADRDHFIPAGSFNNFRTFLLKAGAWEQGGLVAVSDNIARWAKGKSGVHEVINTEAKRMRPLQLALLAMAQVRRGSSRGPG